MYHFAGEFSRRQCLKLFFRLVFQKKDWVKSYCAEDLTEKKAVHFFSSCGKNNQNICFFLWAFSRRNCTYPIG